MVLQIEFDSLEEVQKAMKNLSAYHDCEKCHGKIVGIGMDKLGNTYCGYCGMMVKYPKLSKKGFEIEREKLIKENVVEKYGYGGKPIEIKEPQPENHKKRGKDIKGGNNFWMLPQNWK